ncbi:MAG: hypothetical protein ACUVWX_07275 [Kiritimatiellia bacterium]
MRFGLVAILALLAPSLLSEEDPLYRRITVDYRARPLTGVLEDIGQKVGVRFVGSEELFRDRDSVSYSAVNQEAGRAVCRILRSQGLKLENFDGTELRVSRRSGYEEFKVKRDVAAESFLFAQRPVVKRTGDTVTISFETTGWCDVTVAIEDGRGHIIRHIASGVLGEYAPEPFQWRSKKQMLVWDGKDDQGTYIDEKDECVVRVSLGLAPRFERTLAWSPYKRVSAASLPIIRACAEGVLVYEGQIYDTIRLYDHDGNYLRTIYPFPAGKIGSIGDLHWHVFPQDGVRLPLKEWFRQATLLTSGENSNHPFRGFGEQRFAHDGHGADAPHRAASAMAVAGSRIALAMLYLNRLSLDGSTGGLKLNGPQVCFETQRGGYYASEAREIVKVYPTGAALSPDGKWVYLTGYIWEASFGTGGRKNFWLHGVVRVPFDGEGEPTVFAGVMKDKGGDGTDNTHLRVPTCVACDARGRVYVGDYMNDRIQVYDPAGQYLGSVPVRKPVHIVIDPRTQAISVFSWLLGTWWLQESKEEVKAQFIQLGPFENPGKPGTFDIPLIRYSVKADPWLSGLQYTAEFDPWAEKPTIWLYPGSFERTSFSGYEGEYGGRPYWQPSGLRLYTIEDSKLVLKRDFGKEAAETVKKASRVRGTNRQLWVNPKTGKLWVGDGSACGGLSWSLISEMDPESGQIRLTELPFDTEQISFDADGLVYLRAHGTIVRYNSVDWREVPWDYGEERASISTADPRMQVRATRWPETLRRVCPPHSGNTPLMASSISPSAGISSYLSRVVRPQKLAWFFGNAKM